MNRFDQLVDDLTTGKLGLTLVQQAIRLYIRNREDIPDPIKDILCGGSRANAGLICRIFMGINETIGSMELAYRRGVEIGKEDADST